MEKEKRKKIVRRAILVHGPALFFPIFLWSPYSSSINQNLMNILSSISGVVFVVSGCIIIYFGLLPPIVKFMDENVFTEKSRNQTDIFDKIRDE